MIVIMHRDAAGWLIFDSWLKVIAYNFALTPTLTFLCSITHLNKKKDEGVNYVTNVCYKDSLILCKSAQDLKQCSGPKLTIY